MSHQSLREREPGRGIDVAKLISAAHRHESGNGVASSGKSSASPRSVIGTRRAARIVKARSEASDVESTHHQHASRVAAPHLRYGRAKGNPPRRAALATRGAETRHVGNSAMTHRETIRTLTCGGETL